MHLLFFLFHKNLPCNIKQKKKAMWQLEKLRLGHLRLSTPHFVKIGLLHFPNVHGWRDSTKTEWKAVEVTCEMKEHELGSMNEDDTTDLENQDLEKRSVRCQRQELFVDYPSFFGIMWRFVFPTACDIRSR